ncbi:MAG: DUF1572 family protein [Ginsengibacter sp.]
MVEEYMSSVKKQFEYYKLLGDKTFEQLNDKQFNWQYNQESNSITQIVKHLSGNMLSRWTDFLTTDGEKAFRNRDEEFDETSLSKTEVLTVWNDGWTCLLDTLATISAGNFSTIIYIRNQGHTVIEAINRQVAHYAYHVGQIVFIGKMLLNENWKTLSIAKGTSQHCNADKFSQPKTRTHFTDEFLQNDKV